MSDNHSSTPIIVVINIFCPLPEKPFHKYTSYGDFSFWFSWFYSQTIFSLFLIMFSHAWIPLIHWFGILIIISNSKAAPRYQSSQTTESSFHGATMNILPHGAKPSVHKTYACKQSHLHPGYHPFIMMITLFFLFKADKMHQVFPSYLDTRIKPLPNFWFLSSDVRVSEPAPESCSPNPSWGKVVFISGTRLGFLKTKPSSINK